MILIILLPIAAPSYAFDMDVALATYQARTVKNWISLHHAVRFNPPNIVTFLMKSGSSAHERTSVGLSAIDMARNVNDYHLLSILGAR